MTIKKVPKKYVSFFITCSSLALNPPIQLPSDMCIQSERFIHPLRSFFKNCGLGVCRRCSKQAFLRFLMLQPIQEKISHSIGNKQAVFLCLKYRYFQIPCPYFNYLKKNDQKCPNKTGYRDMAKKQICPNQAPITIWSHFPDLCGAPLKLRSSDVRYTNHHPKP